VRVLSSVEDMPALILACAVTVLVPRILASKMDLPLIVLESLALGRPAIVSREPPLAEALFGAGGYAVRAGDHAALTDALTRVLEAPDTAHELGRRGRAATLAACDPATAVSRYQGVYALALQARARRRGTAGAERPERRHRRHMRGGA
jgi:glycosyltransferase involved in cell wall biosynthesis